MTRPLRILTWHVHGNYLYYLTHSSHQFFLPVKTDRSEGYGGRLPGFDWPDNVHDIPAEAVWECDFDCILFQSHKNYLEDQFEILSGEQQQLPRIFLEHNPPRQHPTDTPHPVNDPDVLLVHVTHFNELMWENGRTPTCVIEHGVVVPDHLVYSGELERGIVVVNGMGSRGRLAGRDIFERASQDIPLDLVGMQSEVMGGLGEVDHDQLHALEAQYRFFFNPIRYTSLGLAVCEAMMVGLPVVGLATTEMVTAIENGVTGYVSTDLTWLTEKMHDLLTYPELARTLGQNARRYARERFCMERFTRKWDEAFMLVAGA